MKVVIFTAHYGNGHMIVASQLRDYFKSRGDEVEIHNPHMETSKPLTKISETIYAEMFSKRASNKYLKGMYGLTFEMFGNKNTQVFSRYGSHQISKTIKRVKPDLIITTFPFHHRKFDAPVVTIITDYGFSKVWYNKNINHYLVGSEEVKHELEKYVDSDMISVIGIPVNYRYVQTNEATTPKTIMFNLGALGIVNKERIVKQITELHLLGLNIEVICGKNKKIQNYLGQFYKDIENIKIHGYVTDMYNVYDRCDLIITKAGGITISESISCEVPLIINETTSLSGQEQMNVEFINKNRIGLTTDEDGITNQVEYMLGNPEIYVDCVNNMRDIKEKYQTSCDETTLDFVRDMWSHEWVKPDQDHDDEK